MSPGAEETGFVLRGEQRGLHCVLTEGRAGRCLPGSAEEETRGGGGVGLCAWRDPPSALGFLLAEREESQWHNR